MQKSDFFVCKSKSLERDAENKTSLFLFFFTDTKNKLASQNWE